MTAGATLPADSRLGRVGLRVADLDRQVSFYRDVVGLRALERGEGVAVLGVDDARLLRLVERPDLEPRTADETGLFHVAFRFPDRGALGDALERVEDRWQLSGASDHRVSEALYLDDPEGNGVELYRDRPRDGWPTTDDGRVEMDTLPLDRGPIRDAARGADRAPAETTVGHVHLEVADIEAARRFYVDGLGLNVRQRFGEDAIFLAAGEYHHHVGANTWNGRTEPGTGLGLDWFEVVVPDGTAVSAVRERLAAAGREPCDHEDGVAVTDPDGIEVRVRAVESR